MDSSTEPYREDFEQLSKPANDRIFVRPYKISLAKYKVDILRIVQFNYNKMKYFWGKKTKTCGQLFLFCLLISKLHVLIKI